MTLHFAGLNCIPQNGNVGLDFQQSAISNEV